MKERAIYSVVVALIGLILLWFFKDSMTTDEIKISVVGAGGYIISVWNFIAYGQKKHELHEVVGQNKKELAKKQMTIDVLHERMK